jgi:hypothetical protein
MRWGSQTIPNFSKKNVWIDEKSPVKSAPSLGCKRAGGDA